MVITKKSLLSILRHLRVINSEFLYIYICILCIYTYMHARYISYIYTYIWQGMCIYKSRWKSDIWPK